MRLHRLLLSVAGAAALTLTLGGHVLAQSAGTIQGPAAVEETNPPTSESGAAQGILPAAKPDQFTNAEKRAPESVLPGNPGVSGGVKAPAAPPPAFGGSTAPYTTVRAAVTKLGDSSTDAKTPVSSYPYRATGRLYFNCNSGKTNCTVCTASLIERGVLVTAAHCVFKFGTNASSGFYKGWVWCPAATGWFSGPYGCHSAGSPRILTTYYNGSDVCAQSGVVCNDDMATLLVPPVNGAYIGATVGWYAYGWNGYSYTQASMLGNVTAVQITELGYPVALDGGLQMQRTDAVGWYYDSEGLLNTQIGSAQTGGSSGGPWLVNFGTTPSVGSGASLGSATTMAVVGVTSYDSTTVGYNRLGASFFGQNSQYSGTYGSYGAGNIGLLVHDTCTASASYC